MSSPNQSSLLEDIDHGPAPTRAKSDERSPASVPGWAQALIIVAALGVGGWAVVTMSGGSNSVENSSRTRIAIDADTGEVFSNFRIREGDTIPFTNPDTGEATLWPAEACHWTADGEFKENPTYVLLDEYKGLPGPTMCPDCNRRVVQHNPMPPLDVMTRWAEANPDG